MIEKILDDYKEITEKIMNNIENDKEVIKLMEEREDLIKSILIDKDNKESIRELYLSKGLLDQDEKLKSLIINEKNKVKEEIANLHKIKNANNAYEKNRNVNNFFNIKI